MDPLVNHFDVLGLAACIFCVVLAREVFVTVSFEQVLAVSRFRFFEFKVAHLLAKVLLIVFGFLFLRSFFRDNHVPRRQFELIFVKILIFVI